MKEKIEPISRGDELAVNIVNKLIELNPSSPAYESLATQKISELLDLALTQQLQRELAKSLDDRADELYHTDGNGAHLSGMLNAAATALIAKSNTTFH
jgi:hypothetical protein